MKETLIAGCHASRSRVSVEDGASRLDHTPSLYRLETPAEVSKRDFLEMPPRNKPPCAWRAKFGGAIRDMNLVMRGKVHARRRQSVEVSQVNATVSG
jgi:hypothetical protein